MESAKIKDDYSKPVRWCTSAESSKWMDGSELEVAAPSGLESFGTLRSLIVSAAESSGQDISSIVSGHEESIALTIPDLLALKPRHHGHFYNSENVGSSVIRRISRESIHLTDAIDDIARLVLNILKKHNNRLLLVNAERLDRPSARVLYRAFQLENSTTLHWTWTFSNAITAGDSSSTKHSIKHRFYNSRHRLFQVLAERMRASIEPSVFALPLPPFEACHSFDSSVAAVSQALVDQNYDRLYVAAAHVDELDSDSRSNIWRMICISDANMGRIDDAAASIDYAYEIASENPWLSAQCLYMRGLLESKRRYNLDAAEKFYRRALTLLSACDPSDDRTLVEQAWATNGLALVRTIHSKQLPYDERESAQMNIFLDEAAAFKSVSHLTSAQALYLQLNLLANMTLLLEVMGRYDQAVSFWSRAFDKFRNNNPGESRNFEVAFLYRLGLLQFKAGHPAAAMNTLDQATTVSGVNSRSFTFERLLLAKGFVELECGELAAAAATFTRGCELSFRLCNDVAFSEHLAGLEEAGAPGSDALAEWSARGLTRGIAKSTKTLRPSPKLPSYVPLVDLEAAPQIDLNRFLADDRSGRPLNAVLGSA